MWGQRRQERRLQREVGGGPGHSKLVPRLELIVGEADSAKGECQGMRQEIVHFFFKVIGLGERGEQICCSTYLCFCIQVPWPGIKPANLCVSGWHTDQLSYWPGWERCILGRILCEGGTQWRNDWRRVRTRSWIGGLIVYLTLGMEKGFEVEEKRDFWISFLL